MANYTNLINSIKAVIKQNGTNDITGQLMQDVLVAMTNSIGRFATFAGVASPTTNPGTIDQNVFFLASIAGTYPNFGGAVVPSGKIVAFDNVSGSWNMSVVVTISGGAITIDIDPTLDPDSVNPVENRVVTGAINGLDSRVTALEQSDVLYNKYVVLHAASANLEMVCSIFLTDNNADIISSLDELASPYFYPILQAEYGGVITGKALAIQLVSGGAAVVMQSQMTPPYFTSWNIPAGGTSFVTSAVLPTRH